MNAIRAVPVARGRSGQCTWCETPVLHERGPKTGAVNINRTWHTVCAAEWKLHAMRPVQLRFVQARDGDRCAECCAAPTTFVSDHWGRKFSQLHDCRTAERLPYTPLRLVSTLELDHKIPLWSVAHLVASERRRFHGPENLWLLCPVCHKAKTAREAGERSRAKQAAKLDRIAA